MTSTLLRKRLGQVVVFERRRHAVDFGLADAGFSSDAAPVLDGFTSPSG
ncbi:hypothetical protein X735_23015 [Mesorhizobium sp. L2C085B000]|nr:hypothetical protein X735_23015 [Mesorhizobium sp. L2C085B000]